MKEKNFKKKWDEEAFPKWQNAQSTEEEKGGSKVGSIVILVLQITCLVLVIVAIVNTRRALRNVKGANENMARAMRHMGTVRTDMEVKFKEIDDAIASLQKRAKKKGNENGG